MCRTLAPVSYSLHTYDIASLLPLSLCTAVTGHCYLCVDAASGQISQRRRYRSTSEVTARTADSFCAGALCHSESIPYHLLFSIRPASKDGKGRVGQHGSSVPSPSKRIPLPRTSWYVLQAKTVDIKHVQLGSNWADGRHNTLGSPDDTPCSGSLFLPCQAPAPASCTLPKPRGDLYILAGPVEIVRRSRAVGFFVPSATEFDDTKLFQKGASLVQIAFASSGATSQSGA